MTRKQFQLWFKEGRENFIDDARPGRPSTSTKALQYENIEAMKKIILDSHRKTIRVVADDVIISFGLCQAILRDVLGMKSAVENNCPTIDIF